MSRKSETLTKEDAFIEVVSRINRYLILLGIFFLIYFFLKTEVDTFLFLLALSNMAFALLSHKHLEVTNRLAVERLRAKMALEEMTRETRNMHSA